MLLSRNDFEYSERNAGLGAQQVPGPFDLWLYVRLEFKSRRDIQLVESQQGPASSNFDPVVQEHYVWYTVGGDWSEQQLVVPSEVRHIASHVRALNICF